jgi:hypothetical protein
MLEPDMEESRNLFDGFHEEGISEFKAKIFFGMGLIGGFSHMADQESWLSYGFGASVAICASMGLYSVISGGFPFQNWRGEYYPGFENPSLVNSWKNYVENSSNMLVAGIKTSGRTLERIFSESFNGAMFYGCGFVPFYALERLING